MSNKSTGPYPKDATVDKKTMDFDPFLNPYAKRLGPSPLKSLLKYNLDENNIILSNGLPRPDMYPIEQLNISVRDPIDEQITQHTIRQPTSQSNPIGLDQAQQYMDGKGNLTLYQFFKDYVTKLHYPQYNDYKCIPTTGNTDALFKMVQLLITEGDPILVARWTYPTALEILSINKCKFLKVDIDDEGLVPKSLEKVTLEWNKENPNRPCKYIYLIPCGQNPTGATMGKQRRKDIYKVAQQFDLIILEDDPYYFLQLPSNVSVSIDPSHSDFLSHYGYETLLPSLLSMDTDGRVIRFDTFSKVIAPGHRIGWITAHQTLVEKIQQLNELSIGFPSGLSQAVIAQLILVAWNAKPSQTKKVSLVDKLEYHIANIRFKVNLRKIESIKWLDKNINNMAQYQIPKAGMFIWMKPNLPKHLIDQATNLPNKRVMKALFDKLVDNHVVLVPGDMFDSDSYGIEGKANLKKLDEPGVPFLRLCFTFADLDNVKLGIEKIGNTFKEFGFQSESKL